MRFDFTISNIIFCIFSDEAINTVKQCAIFYGPNAECDNASLIRGEPSASQTVEISLSLHESAVTDNQDSYCYKIKGTNGTYTITISGIFVTGITTLGRDSSLR